VAADEVTIFLAGAPMGKERVRMTRAGQPYTPERTVNFEGRLALAAQHAMAGRPLFEGALSVDIVALMPVAASKPRRWLADALSYVIRPTKKPDWDNFGKILDAFNLVVWADDAQIVRGKVEKFYHDKPGFAVRVRPAPPAKPPSWALALLEGVFG
jgi:Holliday junction resolvase RusA-like endonuclease